jgi:hypothetical protein
MPGLLVHAAGSSEERGIHLRVPRLRLDVMGRTGKRLSSPLPMAKQ